jgi:hypothetical protein
VSVLLAVLALIVVCLALAGLQALGYRLLQALGWRTGARPFFLILILRGMIVVVSICAILAIIQTISNGKP